MNERHLFDTTQLATRCPICGSELQPNQQRAADCGVDQSRAGGEWIRRPNDCLNMPRPQTDPIPL